MNEKKQAIILLSVVLSILAGLFFYRVQQLETRISNLMIESDAQELNSTVQTLQKYSYAKYGDRIKNLLISDPAIVELFAARDRERLYEHTKIKYDSLKRENPYFHIMQFHLPDGTVFLRMHRFDLFGAPPLGGARPMVDAVHQGQTALSGFEFDREGLFFRVVHPIFVEKMYVGALELGIRAQEVLEAIEENLDEKIISYFVADQWERAPLLQNQQTTKVGRFVVRADNASLINLLPPGFCAEEQDYIVKHEGRSFRVHNHHIFNNFKDESFGGIIFLQDVSAALQRKHSFFWKAALVSLLLFLVAATVLYTSFERIFVSLVNEIEVRKQAEAEVLDREEQVRLLLDSTAEGIFGLDHEGKCTFVNRSCLKLLGYEHEDELLGVTLHDLVHYLQSDGTDFPKAECPMCRSYDGGHEVNIDDEVLWCKDGRSIPVEYHAYPIKHDDHLLGSVISFFDISRRKQAEDDKERLAAAIEHTVDEIIITNLAGVIEYVNPAFERVTGYSREEAVGRTPNVLKSGKHPEKYYQDLWGTIRSGKVWSDRIINKTKSGALIEEEATISPIFDASGCTIGYVAVKRDITGKVKMEERLRQASKMESLGSFSGAIAHDFNNLLNGIVGFTSLSLSELPAKGKVTENLNAVMRAAEIATELIQQILSFSRKESSGFKSVAVQDVAKDVVSLLRCTMPTTIKVDERIDMGCRPIWGNVNQIHQVIMNLATNAYHAMREQGGVLTVHLEESTVRQGDGGEPVSSVQLRISDIGCGIAPDVLGHIFEPYFTTKKEGEGTGLGLATVHEIVKSHHGDMEVQSKLGTGTTFALNFPVSEKYEAAADTKEPPPPLPELGGHVLFVDDAEFNVMLGKEILQSAGCKVTGFSDSTKALEIYRQRPEQFDLVVTDQQMPGLAGAEMAREMIQIRPDIPIIMVSGNEYFSDDAEFSQCGIREFLAKPISVNGLLTAAAEAMRPALAGRRGKA